MQLNFYISLLAGPSFNAPSSMFIHLCLNLLGLPILLPYGGDIGTLSSSPEERNEREESDLDEMRWSTPKS